MAAQWHFQRSSLSQRPGQNPRTSSLDEARDALSLSKGGTPEPPNRNPSTREPQNRGTPSAVKLLLCSLSWPADPVSSVEPLVSTFVANGDDVVVLTRGAGTAVAGARAVTWRPDGSAGDWAHALDGADVVVNLAGESIADGRWTRARKETLRQSRILSTRSLVAGMRMAARKPRVFVSGSAVGYYGTTGATAVDESFPPGSDFLATLCVNWEAEAHAAEALGCRLVVIRTGIVLARDGGVLKKLIPTFQWFGGGPMASGTQFMSWIHRDDWMALVLWAIAHADVSGVFNGTAPTPVTNREFSKALGHALFRPSWITVPPLVLKLAVGEMADIALINGQRVVPKRSLDFGFAFTYPDILGAMRAAVSKRAVHRV